MPDIPSFNTSELTLRPFTPEDVPALQAYLNHPSLFGRRDLPWGFPDDLPLSTAQVENILKKWGEREKGFVLAITKNTDNVLIGHADADWGWDVHSPGVGIVIAPQHQRKGYGSQVLEILLTYLYEETMAHNVSIWTPSWNEPACRFAEKHGFTSAGRERRAGLHGGEYYDEQVYNILRPEWRARKGGK